MSNKGILFLMLFVLITGMIIIMARESNKKPQEIPLNPTISSFDKEEIKAPIPQIPQTNSTEQQISLPSLPPLPKDEPEEPKQILPKMDQPIIADNKIQTNESKSDEQNTNKQSENSIQTEQKQIETPTKKENINQENKQKEKQQENQNSQVKNKDLTIIKFIVFARDKGATIRIQGNSQIKYTSMPLDNPNRLVIDFEGQWKIKTPGIPNNPLVSAIRVGGNPASKTRLVIDLKEKPKNTKFNYSKDNNTLDIRLDQ